MLIKCLMHILPGQFSVNFDFDQLSVICMMTLNLQIFLILPVCFV